MTWSGNEGKIGSLLRILYMLLEYCGENAENSGKLDFVDALGYGWGSFSSYLREGMKAILDLQRDYREAQSKMRVAQIGEQEMRDFLKDMFGDDEVFCLNDECKSRIRNFVQEINNEEEFE